ncbi:hypothetical protein [Burkholderia pseudomallei]|nr:hypothetical protein [Burkholderia pseudomallei]
MATLLDIEPLDRLRSICDEHGVVLWAFGGVVTRAAMQGLTTVARRDLFALTPFTADVDLTHSGRASQTPAILASILRRVPNAEAFRWQLAAIEERTEELEAVRCNNIIPARLISLSSEPNSDFVDPWNGRLDIESKKYRYIRNGFYELSPLYQRGRDLELFSALLYIQTLFEADLSVPQMRAQPGYLALCDVLMESANSIEFGDALRRSPYLRTRLRYLIKNVMSAAPGVDQWEVCLSQMGLGAVLDAASRATAVFRDWLGNLVTAPPGVSLSGATVGVDRMRTMDSTVAWEAGPYANQQVGTIFSNTAPFLEPNAAVGTKTTVPALNPDQDVALVSPLLHLQPGHSPSSKVGPGLSHEFLHFQMALDSNMVLGAPYAPGLAAPAPISVADETDFAALVAVSVTSDGSNGFTQWHIFSVPTVVSIRRFAHGMWGTKLLLRLNCFNIFDEAARLPPAEPAGLHIILLRLRNT